MFNNPDYESIYRLSSLYHMTVFNDNIFRLISYQPPPHDPQLIRFEPSALEGVITIIYLKFFLSSRKIVVLKYYNVYECVPMLT
jgi:hypothetical protein